MSKTLKKKHLTTSAYQYCPEKQHLIIIITTFYHRYIFNRLSMVLLKMVQPILKTAIRKPDII